MNQSVFVRVSLRGKIVVDRSRRRVGLTGRHRMNMN